MSSATLVQKGKYWYVVTYEGVDPVTGKAIRRWIGTGKTRKAEARTDLERILKELHAGVSLGDNPTLLAWLDHWLDTDCRPRMLDGLMAENTYYSYEQNCHLKIAPRIGGIRLRDLRPADLDSLYADLRQRGGDGATALSPRSVWYAHAILHRALKVAVEKDLLITNPADKSRPPRSRQKEQAFLTPEQAVRLIEVNTDDPWLDFAVVAVFTGLRMGELLAVTWADIDLDRGALTVRKTRKRRPYRQGVVDGDPKTPDSRRVVPLAPQALNSLSRIRAWQDALAEPLASIVANHPDRPFCHVYRDKWTPWSPDTPGRNVARLYERAGLPAPKMPVHALRHTFGTLLAAKNVHPKVAQRLLGHGEMSTTMKIYTHVLDEAQRQAIADVGDFLQTKEPAERPIEGPSAETVRKTVRNGRGA